MCHLYCWLLFVFVTLVPSFFPVVFSPAPRIAPQGSIVKSIEKAAVEANFQILVSIYNPNTLDAKINSGTAILLHKHTEVRASKHTAALHFLLPSVYGTHIHTYILHDSRGRGGVSLRFKTGAWLASWGYKDALSEMSLGVVYDVKCFFPFFYSCCWQVKSTRISPNNPIATYLLNERAGSPLRCTCCVCVCVFAPA